MKNPFVLAVLILVASGFLWALGPDNDVIGLLVHDCGRMFQSSFEKTIDFQKGLLNRQILEPIDPKEKEELKKELKIYLNGDSLGANSISRRQSQLGSPKSPMGSLNKEEKQQVQNPSSP